ncbi:MAG: D-glycero-beta-D-manno-heptose-7-phosphate kinase [Bdellovibrionales bacterium]
MAKVDPKSWLGKKVLILGDVGLDEYVLGQVRRISPEAPVPVLDVEQEDLRLGLSANVAQNVASLGGVPLLLSVVGNDEGAQKLKDLSLKAGVSWSSIIVDSSRPTTRKTRVMAGPHHIVRVDYELRKYLPTETEKKLLSEFEKKLSEADIVILQDYAKGVISENVVKTMSKLCRAQGKLLLVDPHRNNPGDFYAGCDLIKPNYEEAVILAGLDFDSLRENPHRVEQAGIALQKKTGAKKVVLTQGKEGMSIFDGEKISKVPTRALKVFDVTGAGDTVIAAIALGLSGGLDLNSSCQLANYAAGIVVGKIGCVPCELEEFKSVLPDSF